MRYAMVMAGGSGTRLWPMSRAEQPKQLIPFVRTEPDAPAQSLLQISAGRLEGVVPRERRYICTGERFRDQILGGLPGFKDENLLGEPAPRDTLNAVGFAAAVFEAIDKDAVFAVLTADHMIEPQATFAKAMDAGFSLVEQDPTRLVSFGIKPTHPATGFGYIENASPIPDSDDLGFTIARFVEKPPLDKAREYLASGNFFWNAGMFVFHAATFMKLLERHAPENAAGLREIQAAWGTPAQTETLERVYPTLPKTSVDYGVMEPASNDDAVTLCGVKMDLDWLDVGSWPSYGETLPADEQGNRRSGGNLATHDSTNCLAVSSDDDHTIALVGCEDLIVVRTDRATLVMPKDRAQDLKALHATLQDDLK
ncbi:MAG: mannose-1-phosphate guanylyltransferase [Planctomycetota bacterium]